VVARLEYPEVPGLAISNVAATLVRGIAGGPLALDKAGVLAARLDALESPKLAMSKWLVVPKLCTMPCESLGVVGARLEDTGFLTEATMVLAFADGCITSADIGMVASLGANCGLSM